MVTKHHYNNVTKMLLYKNSYSNNLTHQEMKYATGEFHGIYFLEAIIKIRWVKKKNKTNKQKKKRKKKKSSPGIKSSSPL